MSNFNEPRLRQRLSRRALALVGAVAVNAALSAGLLTLFHGSSSLHWLPATEGNLALLARCDKAAGTARRRACVEQVVAAVRAGTSSVQMAKQSPSPDPSRR